MSHPQLTIDGVTVRTVRVPLNRPVASKVGSFDAWPLILIDVETDAGITGRAYLEPYLSQAMRYIVPVIEDLAAQSAGKPVAPVDRWHEHVAALQLVGREGVTMIGLAGLDMALWDAHVKAAGQPLAVMLGGTTGPVPAYNSNGLWLSPVDTLAEESAALVAEGGFSALKLRLGRDRLADDEAAITAVRQGAGDDITIMTDFNQGQTRAQALARCHALDDAGLYWFEEPLAYDDLIGHAQLARELKTPIQIGENFYGPRAMDTALALGACDYVMPDLMRIGGITGWQRAAARASAAGVAVSSHLYPEIAAHLLRATDTAHWLEWQDWADPILAEPFVLADGQYHVPDRPGLGIEWDEAAIARYRV